MNTEEQKNGPRPEDEKAVKSMADLGSPDLGPKLTPEQLRLESQKKDYARFVESTEKEYDRLNAIIKEKGYDVQAYSSDAKIEVSPEFFTELSNLLPAINSMIQNFQQSIMGLSELSRVRLLSMNNAVMSTHISNIELGNSKHIDEIEAENSEKKVIEVED